MPKYRKKPVEIDASQWFCKGHCPTWAQHAVEEFATHFEVATLEGMMRGNPGDWIIRDVKGEIYPCKPDVFEATYDPVPDPVPECRFEHVRVGYGHYFFRQDD